MLANKQPRKHTSSGRVDWVVPNPKQLEHSKLQHEHEKILYRGINDALRQNSRWLVGGNARAKKKTPSMWNIRHKPHRDKHKLSTPTTPNNNENGTLGNDHDNVCLLHNLHFSFSQTIIHSSSSRSAAYPHQREYNNRVIYISELEL